MNNNQLDPQQKLIELIKQKIGKDDAIGLVISDVLNISTDAAYRRLRGEKAFTIHELGELSKHFDISLDKLFEVTQKSVTFDYLSLNDATFSLEIYLSSILDALLNLKNKKNPSLILTVNNTPFFQLLNFPELVRFKLFFWMKMHLQLKQYQQMEYCDFSFSASEKNLIAEILQLYVSIPSTEVYDSELLQGFAREVSFYKESNYFKDQSEAIALQEAIHRLIDHIEHQALLGEKFKVNTQPLGNVGNLLLYYNETLNAVASFYYSSDESDGLFLAHNFMNSLHTSNKSYVEDTKIVLDRIILNSSKISESNSKEKNQFFGKLREHLSMFGG